MGLRDWLERVMLAVTFAEANDHKTARELLKKKKTLRKRIVKRVQKRLRLRPPNYKA